MMDTKTSFVLLTTGLALASSFACNTGDKPVSTTRSALTQGWTPQLLDPSTQAWFTAAAGVSTDPNHPTLVSSWTDQLHGTVLQALSSPQYKPNGWGTGVPTITFAGGQLLATATAWSGVPTGTQSAYTILAVLRSAAPQTATVAGWWDPNGQGYAWIGVKQAGNLTFLDSWRVYANAPGEAFAGSQDIGTTAHVVAWRHDPSTGVITEVIDGVSSSSSSIPAIGPLPAMPLIVGARSLLPTSLFQGDISELRIVARALGDDEIQNYMEYSRSHWQITTPAPSPNPCLDASNNPTPPESTRCDDGNAQTYGDHCYQGTCIGTVPPSGSPAELSPIAWYHANPQEVVVTENGVSTWFDRTQNHRDLMQPFYYGRPTLGSTWAGGRPTLHFSGGQGMRRDGWSGSPLGSSQPFTILAVFQSGAPGQSSSIASWWNASYSTVSASLTASNGDSVPSVVRQGESAASQSLPDPVALGTTAHAVVWRYTPDTLTMTVDGQSMPPTPFPAVDSILASVFLVGMRTYLPTGLFNGDLAELVVVPNRITDEQVAAFGNYVAVEWGGSFCSCQAHAHCVDPSGSLACACDADWGGSDCSQPLGTIAGQVLYQGAPLAGAVVTLRAISGTGLANLTALTAVTDAQGHFEIHSIPPAITYQVTARTDGATPLVGTEIAAVTPGETQLVAMDAVMDPCKVLVPTLQDQVSCCKQQLAITNMPPAGSCAGPNTLHTRTQTMEPSGDILSDRLGYFKVTDDVDAVFHCKHVDQNTDTQLTFETVIVEMSIHSRSLGTTCFVGRQSAVETTQGQTSADFPSLDDVYSTDATTVDKVNNFWQFNAQNGTGFACSDCHRFGGPYLVETLADAMQTFGLLNNGHDTTQSRYSVVDASESTAKMLNFDIIGGDVAGDINTTSSPNFPGGGYEGEDGCASNCHKFFEFPPNHTPNLGSDPMTLFSNGTMPPTSFGSPYRWMNRDSPNGFGDSELLTDEQTDYVGLYNGCKNPNRLEAHVLGSEVVFATDDLPDRLSTFNLRDGLVCLNSQQANQQCHDYSVRYLCASVPTGGDPFDMTGGYWTDWHNGDSNPADDGDHELRANFPSLCVSGSSVGTPIALEAVTTDTQIVNGVPSTVSRAGFAPNDKLATFDPSTGLVCLNSDQPAGQTCSNYVVRFDCLP